MASNNSGALVVRPSTTATAEVETNDIRAIKPPVEIHDGWLWVIWIVAVIAFFVILGIIKARIRRHFGRVIPQEPVVPPHVRARQRLERALGQIADPRVFVIEISEALRVYLEEQFQLRAPERTTEEFLNDLKKTNALNEQQKLALSQFLEHCDLVKFARFEPTEQVLRGMHESALRLVDETSILAAPSPAPTAPAPASAAC